MRTRAGAVGPRLGTRRRGGVHGLVVATTLGILAGSAEGAAQSPPPAPQNVDPTALSSNKVRITWSPVNVSGGVKEYRVYRQLLGAVERIFAVTTTFAIDSVNVQPTTTYDYFVTAVDTKDREGAQSTAVSVTTPPPDLTAPSAPSGLTGNATGPVPPGVDLSWSASSDAETGIRHYRVYRDGTRIDTSGTRSYHDASVQGNTTYQYEITALNWEGLESQPAQTTVTTRDDTPPTAPTGLTAQAASHARVDLSWSAASDPESGVAHYDILRNGASVGSSTTTSFADTGVQETTTYTYEVVAVNGEGLPGPKSAPATVTTPAAPDQTPPSAPTGLSGSAGGPDRIDLSWSAASDPESGISGYRVYRDGNRVGSPGGTSFSDTGLQPSTAYQYRVTAVNGGGLEGPASASVTVTTDDPADSSPPSTPTDLTATAASPTRVDLSWTASSDPQSGITGYRVYRGGTLVATEASTSWADTTAVPETTYSYEVSAVNGAGLESGRSAPASVTTPRAPDTVPPAPPTRLRIVP